MGYVVEVSTFLSDITNTLFFVWCEVKTNLPLHEANIGLFFELFQLYCQLTFFSIMYGILIILGYRVSCDFVIAKSSGTSKLHGYHIDCELFSERARVKIIGNVSFNTCRVDFHFKSLGLHKNRLKYLWIECYTRPKYPFLVDVLIL